MFSSFINSFLTGADRALRTHTHISTLRQIVVSTLAIVSGLTSIDDRFAITYIDRDSIDGFSLLLPLGTHSLDSARAAIDMFSVHQLTNRRTECDELQGVTLQVSEMLCLLARPALCHLFFVTANTSVQLSTPVTDRRIGFHTVSPNFCFPFNGSDIPSGWHVFYDINSYDTEAKEFILKDKISTVIENIRTGIEPGLVTDLQLDFTAGERCHIQPVLEESYLDLLRPGEKWVIPVQIKVPSVSAKRPLLQLPDRHLDDCHQALKSMMVELQDLLEDFSHENIAQHIMSSNLKYRHSLFPAENVVSIESPCTVVRDVQRVRDDLSLDT